MDLIKKLQADPQLFKDYRESIHKIRSKEYYERYNNTVCLIENEFDHEDLFVINSNVLGDPDPDEMDVDMPETLNTKLNTACCLISDC
jgi:hypothetical protein